MNNTLEQILDFLKTLKSPAVNFFLVVLFICFAPEGTKWFSVFPASLFLGWLFTYIKTTFTEMTLYKRYQNRILALSEEERKLLREVKDQKSYSISDGNHRTKKTYEMLRRLESLGLIESGVKNIAGSKWYYFFIGSMVEVPYRKILQDESV